jgi:hypothetical protein
MKENSPFIKLPLYLGLALFMMTVLLTGTKLGDNKSLTSLFTKANEEGAALSLQSLAGDSVAVFVDTKKEVSGMDITLKIEPKGIHVIPSTLVSGPGYAVSGGTMDPDTNTFSFSALRKPEEGATSYVATFKLEGIGGVWSGLTADMSYVLDNDATVVLEKSTGKNILIKAEKLSFPLKGP